MANNIKDTIYSGTGKSFEQTFKQTSKGSQEYSDAIKALADELARVNALTDQQKDTLKSWLESLDDINKNWENIHDYVEDTFDLFEDFSDELKNVREAFTNIVKDLTNARQRGTETVKLFRNLRDISGDLERSLTVQNGFSEANLNSIQKRAQKSREIYEYNLNALGVKKLDKEAIEEVAEKTEKAYKSLKSEYDDLVTKDDKVKWLQEHGDEVRKLKGDLELLNFENYKHVVTLDEQSTRYKKLGQDIRQHSMGLGLMARALEKLGVSGAKEDYENYVQGRANAELNGGPAPSGGDLVKSWLTSANLSIIAFGLVAGMVKRVWTALKEVSSEAAKLQQNIGKFPYSIASANTEFASSKQYLETANELAQQFGQNPISFIGEKEVAKLAEAKNLLGLSAEQAGNVGIRAKVAGQNMDQYTESIVRGVNQGNAMNRSTVAHGVALKEVLSTSDDITLSLGNSGERLGKAIVAAKNLGMTLKDVDNIAGQLLNFESSIENEMKAQLLTGNQMNLSRARALALQNDLEGVAKELTKQNIDAVKFGQMNRIQQESVASALGMSREQLGKMLVQQANLKNLSEDQVKAATGMTKGQLEAMGISERWKVAVDKLAQAFTPMLEAVIPIVTWLSKGVSLLAGILGKPIAAWIVGITVAASSLLSVVSKIHKIGGLGGIKAGIGGAIKNAFTSIKERLTGKGGAAVGAAGAVEAAERAGSTPAPKATGGRWTSLGKDLAGFFKAIGKKDVWAGILAAPAMGVAGAVAAPGIALLSSAGNIPHKGLRTLGTSLKMFFKTLGQAAKIPAVWLGIALMAAIGAALIPLSYAIGLAAPAIEAIGSVIKSTLEGIGAVLESAARGFATITEAIHGMTFEDIGKMMLLGPAVLGLGVSLGLALPSLFLGSLGLGLFSKQIKKLSIAGKGIGLLASNMRQLAAAVGELKASVAGLDTKAVRELSNAAIKATVVGGIKAVAGRVLGTKSGEISSASARSRRAQQGTGAEEQQAVQVSTAKIETLLTTIANRLNEGYDVYLDADKVGRTLAVRTTQG